MCGRYTLFKLEQLLKQFPWLQLPPDVRPRYNIAPAQSILAVSNESPDRCELLHWGLIPSWAKEPGIGNRMINARAETLSEKPAFRNLLRRRRCLIPADGFYEWRREPDGSKTPIHVRLKSGDCFMLAGLWDQWHDPDGQPLRSCTIITTKPNTLMQAIHDRMPAIVSPDQYQQWLQGPDPPAALGSYPAEQMEAVQVSRFVNNARNESPDCIDAIVEP